MGGTKHTPGPWLDHPVIRGYVIPAAHADRRIGAAGDPIVDLTEYAQTIAHIDPYHRHRSREEQLANIRLIAAAPDLLEALLAAVDCGMVPISSAKEGGAMAYVKQAQVADLIRAAIAKAVGHD